MSAPNSIYVFYHKNCYDGFGAAWVAHRLFGDGAKYIPRYWEDTAKIDVPAHSRVFFLDVAIPRPELVALKDICEVVVLDHHRTARDKLSGLPSVFFDMNKSGAKIAWEYFFPGESAPPLLDYIEDRDLWRFCLPNSQEVNAALESYPLDFHLWDTLQIEDLIREGKAILRLRARQVEVMCEQAYLIRFDGHTIPVVNATVLFSETASALCAKFKKSPFAMYYYIKQDGMLHVGLRSQGDFDVSVVASKYGGGGHKNAAGFSPPIDFVRHLQPDVTKEILNEKSN